MKQKITEVTPEQIKQAQEIVRHVVAMQSMPNDPILGTMVVQAIIKDKGKGLRVGLHNGLHNGVWGGLWEGLCEGLDDGLHSGLDKGLREGLSAKLREGLYTGLYNGLRDGLNAGLRVGLDADLRVGLHAGLREGLNNGLRDGLREGLDAGLITGLRDGLREGLDAGVNAELSAALREGLWDGLNKGLDEGLREALWDGLHAGKIEHAYCGVSWSWWLVRYLIAYSWGVPLDVKKLGLLYGYCRHAQLLGRIKQPDGSYRGIVLPNPANIKWREVGLTDGAIPLPIFELHSEGEPTVESCVGNLYFHHNTKIPERMGTTKPSEWRVEWIADEQNAEVRMILIKELGIDRVMDQGKVVDTYSSYNKPWYSKSEYELVDMGSVLELDYAPYLKMRNQTTGVYHLEGVSPDCQTIEDALAFRTGLKFNNVEIRSIQ